MIRMLVDRHSGDQRLDRWLRKNFPQASLSLIFSVLRKKKVRVNGVVSKGADWVRSGDEICIYENLPQSPSVAEVDMSRALPADLEFLQRSADWMVVNKPAGMASQPGSGVLLGDSLVEWLELWARREGLDFKPALVHRLDQETSGLMLVALSGPGVRELNRLMRGHQVRKEYLALVKGRLAEKTGTIELDLQRVDSARGAKMAVGEGKFARTHYRVEMELGEVTLVKIHLETGRMHQIRAHFAHLGHPLLGDDRYGDFALNRLFKRSYGLKRLFLHADFLQWPWHGETHWVHAGLPAELDGVLSQLRKC